MSRMKPREPGSPNEALAEFFGGDAGIGIKRAADSENVSLSTLYNELNPDLQGEITFARVARLTARFRNPIAARYLAELADCLLIQLPRGIRGDALSREAGLSAQAFGQLMTDFGAAVVDGTVDAREARAVLVDIHALMTALAGFAETLRARAEDRP